MRNHLLSLAALGLALAAAACSGETPKSAAAEDAAPAATEAAAPAPAATGNVIEVKMVTDDRGNYFEPAQVNAKAGDVIRFTLVTGVHNVSFPAEKNAGRGDLPEASPYLQLAGQTHDYTVALPAGEYAFQCDPHAALGMVGTLKVE